MSSVVTLIILLMALAGICLAIIFFHNKSKQQQAGLLANRFATLAGVHRLRLSVTDKLVHGMLGIDYGLGRLFVVQEPGEWLIDIGSLQHCRKIKKWLHIPAGNGKQQPETHLEKIVLLCERKQPGVPVELVFYEYRHNSIFQMQELDQQANYWEILINQQIKHHEKLPA